ncbi:MAG: tetratricopeptide repeat protein [Kiritimatiellia bacterium]
MTCSILLLSAGISFAAITNDFADDFQAAVKLFNSRNYEDSHAAFLKFSGQAPTPRSKDEAISYAALSLGKQKKYDQAIEIANTIELRPFSIKCRMELMLANQQEKELIAEFMDEEIDEWPEALITSGYYLRGQAYSRLKNYRAALDDFEQAARNACDRDELVNALLSLAGVAQILNDDQKSVDACRKIIALTNRWHRKYTQAVLGLAAALKRQGKYDEALQELGKLEIPKTSGGDWHLQILSTYGDIYEACGDRGKALAKYREALAVTNAQAGFLVGVQNKIKILTAK